MPKNKLVAPEQESFIQGRNALLERINHGDISIGEAIRTMRELLGMTQTEYGDKVAKVSRKALSQLENNQGDPRLSTINRCCKAFGLEAGLVQKRL
ncbi:helix-turn-helix domain-containing protein [Gilvimarinus xylanilyticus]|uniref:Helix-turn-helix domain-containing protein n=1 Tax=Gilvimarinus xylanilyticus TaxID=2944139 RepID=A0A9X2I5A5_9GAMM|nr:helix-turn-helix transcriptional regulator [Gilvimarinus xylanilyticus]MCP8900620.1 helix-turn-helix domain-containing protein [Gilvimarinus xylanilyticus]